MANAEEIQQTVALSAIHIVLGLVWLFLGVVLLIYPVTGIVAAIWVFAVLLVIDGLFLIATSITARRRWWRYKVAQGLAALGIGILGLAQPALFAYFGAGALYFTIVAALLVLGTIELASLAVGWHWRKLLSGLALLLIGALAILRPVLGAFLFSYAVAVVLIIVCLAYLAMPVRAVRDVATKRRAPSASARRR